jgi:hypothetical protein
LPVPFQFPQFISVPVGFIDSISRQFRGADRVPIESLLLHNVYWLYGWVAPRPVRQQSPCMQAHGQPNRARPHADRHRAHNVAASSRYVGPCVSPRCPNTMQAQN